MNADQNDDAALAGRSPDTPAGPEAGDGAGETEPGGSRRSRGHRGGRRRKGAAGPASEQNAGGEAAAGADDAQSTAPPAEAADAAPPETPAAGEGGHRGDAAAASPRTFGGYSVRGSSGRPARLPATQAVTEPPALEAVLQPVAEDVPPPLAAEGEADEPASEESARPGRRRHRGGRRHKSAAQRAAAVTEAVGAAVAEADAMSPAAEGPPRAVAPDAAGPAAEPAEQASVPPRRRRSPRRRQPEEQAADAAVDAAEGTSSVEGATAPVVAPMEPADAAAAAAQPKPARRRRRGGRTAAAGQAANGQAEPVAEITPAEPAEEPAAEAQPKPARRRRRGGRTATAVVTPAASVVETTLPAEAAAPADEAPAAAGRTRRSPRRTAPAAVTAETATPEPGVVPEPTAATTAGSAEEGRRRGRRASRRPAGPPPIPPTERVILASQAYGELRVVLLEQGRLAEVYFQRPERPSYLGNIYRAKVESVLRGMDAAFVDFGLEKNGFLHVDEVTVENGGARRGRRITQLLQNGQEILVQVTKDPMGSKGARLTTRMSLPGRYLVYVPDGSGVGVSRRLPQEERERLRDVCKELKAKEAGLIVRTVAEGKGLEELRRDLQYLTRSWSRIKAKAKTAPVPGLVHEEVDVALSVARDLFNESCSRFIVDGEKLRKEVAAYISRVAPELVDRIELHEAPEPLFDVWGIEEQLDRTLARRVLLPSGGNIVIDHAEALTVIDVNSGKYTGGSGLEDTITKTNLEAASEAVHQLRLRDIGGIIVIDFIDMERAENRKAVLGTLEAELATDRTKTYVVEISPLGLVEMTRQNTTDGARGILTKPCPTCLSTARVASEDTVARRVERQLRSTAASSRAAALLIEVNGNVAQRLTGNERIRRLEKDTGKKFLFQGSKTLPVDTFELVAGGSLKEVETQRIPVTEGSEMDVEMEHSLTYSPRDAVAVVEGYPLVVKNGRQFLGTRRRVRVETAIRSGGTAVIVGPAAS